MKKLILISIFISACSAPMPETTQLNIPGKWTPTEVQIKSAFSSFYSEAEKKIKALNYTIAPWKNYRIQYAGVWEHEEKYIHFIAVCNELWKKAPNWKTSWVYFEKQTPCYFSATYKLKEGSINVHM